MSLEILLNERHRQAVEIRKIDQEVWEILKSVRSRMYKGNRQGKKAYKILKARLHEKKTLDEVGREFGVTRERIRQLEFMGVCIVDNLLIENKNENLN